MNFEESMEAAVYERLMQAAKWQKQQCLRHLERCLILAPAERPAPPSADGGER